LSSHCNLEKGLIVAILEKDFAARVTAIPDVIAEATGGYAGSAWHAAMLRSAPGPGN